MPMDVMHFYDDRYGTQMYVSQHTNWAWWQEYRFIIADNLLWVRIDQTYDYEAGRFPHSLQKIDAVARSIDPRMRLVRTGIYDTTAGEVLTRTYKVL